MGKEMMCGEVVFGYFESLLIEPDRRLSSVLAVTGCRSFLGITAKQPQLRVGGPPRESVVYNSPVSPEQFQIRGVAHCSELLLADRNPCQFGAGQALRQRSRF